VSDEVLRFLEQQDWPGNVRQLEGVIESAAISCDGEIIEQRHLPRTLHPRQPAFTEGQAPRSNKEFLELKRVLRDQASPTLNASSSSPRCSETAGMSATQRRMSASPARIFRP